MNRLDRYARTAFALTAAFALFAISSPLFADEAFGFGDGTESGATESIAPADSSPIAVNLSGEIGPSVTVFADDADSSSSIKSFEAGALASGALNVSASGSNADAFAAIDFSAESDGTAEVSFDEAYVRAYFGKLDLEAGLRKVTWGKADSSGPLDVVNPLDLTDLTVTDSLDRKMARPILRASYAIGDFTSVEAIFQPSFAGHDLAFEGMWTPRQITALPGAIAAEAQGKITALVMSGTISLAQAMALRDALTGELANADLESIASVDTSSLKYSQGGLRFTTTVGSSDIGVQYWYGYLPKPAISIDVDAMLAAASVGGEPLSAVHIDYNRFHQIGADYASVIGAFNVRAELAANVTEDLSGDDGEVYNPSIAWSLGFDRDVFAAINLNAQAGGSVRLMDGEVADSVSDTEAGEDLTHTTLTMKLSRKFLKDEIEINLAGLYGIEDMDFLILPSIVWTKGDVEVELAGGIFGGDDEGEIGHFGDNDYASLSMTYTF